MPKISEMYAFIAVDADPDDEGIVAQRFDVWMPLVGADMARVKDLKPIAERIAQVTGKRIVLAKFTSREDLEVIEP